MKKKSKEALDKCRIMVRLAVSLAFIAPVLYCRDANLQSSDRSGHPLESARSGSQIK